MQQLKKHFESEEYKSYRAIPFWSWNDKLEKKELLKQVDWMDKCGIGGFFMHARSGLQTEYLSEEWMECIEACAEQAEKSGMKAWVYDENGWPSGFAGRKLLEDEKNRDKYIAYTVGDFCANATVSYLITNDELKRVSCGNVIGEYLNLFIHTAVSTVDILNPDVVDQFIALTHEVYRKHFGEQFSKKIEGFFTDEPQYQRWNIPYTDMIAKYFRERYDEDILDSLGLLFVEKKGYHKFRYRYWKGMQELMLHNFAEKVYGWCQEHGVKLTGHYVEEIGLGLQMMCCGGVMPFYEYENIPGIDWLGTESNNELSVIQVASVAAQLGKKQVLTETFGCCGWDVTPTDLRRIAGFQYVNGANMICHHLIPYTERGNRRYDCPAHYSDVNPWVSEEFKSFNEYFTRLGYLLGEGKNDVKVAMLHPLRSAYFNYKREQIDEGFGVRDLDASLYHANKLLGKRGVAFHYLDETLLAKHGFVENGAIGCGKCSYEYLVIPMIFTMDCSTERLLRQFVEQGGKVLLLDKKPQFVEAERYDYPYLSSNCTLEDIVDAQPFRVGNVDTEVYSTYRTLDDMQYLYVINSSCTNTYSQSFDFGEGIRSFQKLDLKELTMKRVPLDITLKPGEDALLFLDKAPVTEEKKLVPYSMRFVDAEIDFAENYLPVDYIRYSTDGITFSEPWPCPALFQKMLKDRYEGNIFFRYEFEIAELPQQLFLKTEENREVRAWLNGIPLSNQVPSKETYISIYDITTQVQLGLNEYTVEVDWHEDEFVYYALYGENVTESLKNCVVYDSELQPIQLTGKFGVYSKSGYKETEPQFVEGNEFYIGKVPEKVTDITLDGFPFLAGAVTLSQTVVFETPDVLLQIAGDYQIAEVTVNGVNKGVLLFDKELDISDVALLGENEIKIRFLISNRNLMGPHHLNGSKRDSVTPWSFELFGTWQEDKSAQYHAGYDLKLFYE